MISEVWNAGFNIRKIYESLQNISEKHSAKEVYPGYAGWSVLSEDGSHLSGWNENAVVFNQYGEMDLLKSYELKKSLGLMSDQKHNLPTEFMTDELNAVYLKVSEAGLEPCRMRISILKAGHELYWHSDAPPEVYSVRLHIPLITNSESFFETENEKEHFKADGSAYFVKVNQRHRVVNGGSTDRWHLIMDVKDTRALTQFHQFKN